MKRLQLESGRFREEVVINNQLFFLVLEAEGKK